VSTVEGSIPDRLGGAGWSSPKASSSNFGLAVGVSPSNDHLS
jgi:hypothetical protein